jgi:CheY-like chemotaxis protein
MSAPLVLLAEDDEDVRALAELVLRRAGYDVAVLDVSMPRLDGLDTARALRERPETRSIPIMLLTARVTDADRERGRAVGVDGQLDKPFSPAVLAERVGALLST